jgi:hypothetical protein
MVTKVLRKDLDAIPGKHSIHSLLKTAILENVKHNTENTAV